ncbi:hypothetical protein C8Q74DRAFT_1370843 [Fomes fomentarius]|nr:hypothetical protein C8Q74DRAFT_1370843 [Fomes fomentarius]
MFLIRAEPTTSTLMPVSTPTTAHSGPSAHTVLVRSIVVGVVAVVLGLCVCGWIIYMLHGWWAIRAEALRPRGTAEREPTVFDIESDESSEGSTDDTHVQR